MTTMRSYLISSFKEIRNIYLPEKRFFDTNPFIKHLNRTDKALKKAILIGSGPAALLFDEEKFLQNTTLEDFKKDVFDIVSERKWIFLKGVQEFSKTQINQGSVQYQLRETKKDIEHSIKLLYIFYSDAPSSLDKAVMDVLSESYQSVLDELFSQYDHLYPGVFPAPVLIKETNSKKEKEAVQSSLAGLILDKATMPTGRAEKLCKWLKNAELIHKDTKHQTLRNTFVRRKTSDLTKVQWIGHNSSLKYLIDQLHEAEIIKPSAYNQKWKDVTSVFIDRQGNDFVNTKFSKNSESPNPEVQAKIDGIVRKLKAEINK